jgi:hypothetical protein
MDTRFPTIAVGIMTTRTPPAARKYGFDVLNPDESAIATADASDISRTVIPSAARNTAVSKFIIPDNPYYLNFCDKMTQIMENCVPFPFLWALSTLLLFRH